MRDIKFRAWDFNNKRMIAPSELIFHEHTDVEDHFTDKQFHFLQFTGLKDKSGVEIYECDIVKWDDCSNGRHWRVAVVELFPALQFKCFDCPAIVNSSAHGHTFKFGSFIYTDTHNHLEMIGNIYENHELLK